MGFLAVAAAAPAAGPAAPIVLGAAAIGTALSKILGIGPPSSGTNYRPPSNSQEVFVPSAFGDGAPVAFDMRDLGAAIRGGNKEVDLRSYYSAWISNSVDAGASPAAKRVIIDALKKYGGSVRSIAETLLSQAGVKRVSQPKPVPGPMAPAPMAQMLAQTKPVELPQIEPAALDILDLITGALKKIITPAPPALKAIPLPPAPTPPPPAPATSGGQNPITQQAVDLAIQKGIQIGQAKLAELLARKKEIENQAMSAGCDPGATYYDPATNQCVILIPCPDGSFYDPGTGQCVNLDGQDVTGFLDSLGKIGGIPIWLILLLGGIVISQSGGSSGKTVTFRRKR